jgi:hypothetical protein
MFADDMTWRQLGYDPCQEKHPDDDDAEIVNLAKPKEKVRNRVER